MKICPEHQEKIAKFLFDVSSLVYTISLCENRNVAALRSIKIKLKKMAALGVKCRLPRLQTTDVEPVSVTIRRCGCLLVSMSETVMPIPQHMIFHSHTTGTTSVLFPTKLFLYFVQRWVPETKERKGKYAQQITEALEQALPNVSLSNFCLENCIFMCMKLH